MTTTFSPITRTFARYIALPAASAGILGAAALGLAGMANAGTYSYEPTPRPGIVATPNTIARPPVVVMPGHRWHRHHGFAVEMARPPVASPSRLRRRDARRRIADRPPS